MDRAARGSPRAHRVGPLGVINWGGVALGAATGIVAALLLNLAVDVILAWESSIPSIIIHFSATVGAGYIAGRFAVNGPAHNGAFAGLGLFLFAGVVALLNRGRTDAPGTGHPRRGRRSPRRSWWCPRRPPSDRLRHRKTIGAATVYRVSSGDGRGLRVEESPDSTGQDAG